MLRPWGTPTHPSNSTQMPPSIACHQLTCLCRPIWVLPKGKNNRCFQSRPKPTRGATCWLNYIRARGRRPEASHSSQDLPPTPRAGLCLSLIPVQGSSGSASEVEVPELVALAGSDIELSSESQDLGKKAPSPFE